MPAVGTAFAASDYEHPDDIYRALAAGPSTRIELPGGMIEVVFADGAPGLDRDRTLKWIKRSASALATYFGRYPVEHYGLLVIAEDGAKVGHGTTFGYRGSITRIHVGRDADDAAFARDWVMVHEMMHTALPDLPRRALWLQEGNATWLEPVARAQAGELPIEEVWRQALHGMPRGLPTSDEVGMDGTQRWGRLYWGGATFWLLAEVAVYEQSHGRHLLRDAIRAINVASGGNVVDWTPEQLMAVGDAATGTQALRTLYAAFAEKTGADGPRCPVRTPRRRDG